MSDSQKAGQKPKPEPDEDLLDFLGGIDELNEDSQDGDFSDFLARTDIDKIPADGSKPKAPEGKKE